MRSDLHFVPLALLYLYLLVHSWEPDTLSLILPGSLAEGFKGGFSPQFLPSLSGIQLLFSRVVTAASLWVHIMAINLYAARAVYLQGLAQGVPVRHTVLLCAVCGPVGLLSHLATCALWNPVATSEQVITAPGLGPAAEAA
ncbi:hypothetical protein WJX81_006808 [Elliptochloris bilobata]|uniref:Uncharacterized protein n=1 Tax=Elliptochloris bilobata TaxID=381761 RepID=A0AAW1S9V8_9CHLO